MGRRHVARAFAVLAGGSWVAVVVALASAPGGSGTIGAGVFVLLALVSTVVAVVLSASAPARPPRRSAPRARTLAWSAAALGALAAVALALGWTTVAVTAVLPAAFCALYAYGERRPR